MAVHDFLPSASEADNLTLKEGDKITVVSRSDNGTDRRAAPSASDLRRVMRVLMCAVLNAAVGSACRVPHVRTPPLRSLEIPRLWQPGSTSSVPSSAPLRVVQDGASAQATGRGKPESFLKRTPSSLIPQRSVSQILAILALSSNQLCYPALSATIGSCFYRTTST